MIVESLEQNAIEPVLVVFVCQKRQKCPRDTEKKRKTEEEHSKASSRATTPAAHSLHTSIS